MFFITKNPNLKKIVYVFFSFFVCFFLVKGVGEGKARVSECLTMDPNKKMFLEGGGEVAGGGG